jgi:hypothetical protein
MLEFQRDLMTVRVLKVLPKASAGESPKSE